MSAPKLPVPLYPVAELVLFPRALVPLHVHELRYRTMVRDVLSGERVIALAPLKPGWEGKDRTARELYDLVSLARLEEVEWLPNDCFDLKLIGIGRARIQRVVREFPYRSARVDVLQQEPYSADDPFVGMERHALIQTRERRPEVPRDPREPPLRSMDYEQLVNTTCMRLDLGVEERLELLALDSLIERGRRARALLEVESEAPPEPQAPPTGEQN